jgi:hypothetical protein
MTPPIVGWDEPPEAYWARQARGTPRGSTGPVPAPEKKRGRVRWNPQEIEALKVVIAEVPKRWRPPETIRVSVIPLSGGYADVRVYRGGRPTRQGLVIHRDLVPAVLDGLTVAASTL